MAEARILYLATADGLVQLANPGKSDRWREVGRALQGQDVRSVVASPGDPLLAYAASSAGVARTTNGGFTWEIVQSEPVRALAFDAAGVLYAGTERGVVLSSPDGALWTEADASNGPIVQITAVDENTLLSVAADGTVCERVGDHWRPREWHVPHVRGLAARPVAPHHLFIVNMTSLVTPYGTHRLPAPPTGAIVILAGQDEVLLIGTQASLLRSPDEGATLDELAGPMRVTVLVTPPRFIDQAFAGTDDGRLWFSADRGRNWTQLAAGYRTIRSIAFARAL